MSEVKKINGYDLKDSTARSSISDLNDTVSNLSDTVLGLNNEISRSLNLKDMPTLFIGDSYTNPITGYAEYYKTYIGLDDSKFFKYASGGAGWYATGTGGKTYEDNLDLAIADMTPTEKENIKLIIVGCGLNDASYSSTKAQIMNNINSFITKANANYPNAKIYVLNCGYATGKNSSDGGKRSNLDNIVIPATLDCNNNNDKQLYVITNSHLWLRNNDWFNVDGMHPNDTGHKIIAKRLIKALNGDFNIRYTDTNLTITIPDQGQTLADETLTLPVEITDNTVSIKLNSNTRLYNIKNLTNITYNEIGTWSCKLLHFSGNATGDIPIVIRCVLDGPQDNFVNAILRLGYDGKVYIYPMATQSFSNMINFTIYPINNVQTMLLK